MKSYKLENKIYNVLTKLSCIMENHIKDKIFFNVLHDKDFISKYKITRAVDDGGSALNLESDYVQNGGYEIFSAFNRYIFDHFHHNITYMHIFVTSSEDMGYACGKCYYFDDDGNITKS